MKQGCLPSFETTLFFQWRDVGVFGKRLMSRRKRGGGLRAHSRRGPDCPLPIHPRRARSRGCSERPVRKAAPQCVISGAKVGMGPEAEGGSTSPFLKNDRRHSSSRILFFFDHTSKSRNQTATFLAASSLQWLSGLRLPMAIRETDAPHEWPVSPVALDQPAVFALWAGLLDCATF